MFSKAGDHPEELEAHPALWLPEARGGVPRGRPNFANHQINKKVSNFTADYSRPGNSKISFTANSAGNPGGQVRKQRAAGVGESVGVNKNQYFTCYQEYKVCNSGSKQLASYPAERTLL